MIDRRPQLESLVSELRQLLAVLQHDALCNWTEHFENCLAQAEHLLVDGFSQEEVIDLSSSITGIYGGSGSFNDYPGNAQHTGVSGRYLSELTEAVFVAAQELRVIGRY